MLDSIYVLPAKKRNDESIAHLLYAPYSLDIVYHVAPIHRLGPKGTHAMITSPLWKSCTIHMSNTQRWTIIASMLLNIKSIVIVRRWILPQVMDRQPATTGLRPDTNASAMDRFAELQSRILPFKRERRLSTSCVLSLLIPTTISVSTYILELTLCHTICTYVPTYLPFLMRLHQRL